MKIALALLTVFLTITTFSQTPGVKWTKYLDANHDGEAFYDIKATPDHGYIVVGADSFYANDNRLVHTKFYKEISWVAKLDSAGNVSWRHSNQNFVWKSALTSVVLSSDGGYVVAGYGADIFPPYDTSNFYIAKYGSTGNLLWQKVYGGSFIDGAYSISKTSSGGYVVAGHTKSNDGNVSGNHSSTAYSDVWLIKTDGNGNLVWQKCFGGSSADTAYSVIETADKGFVVAGSSRSSNGDLTGNNGQTDGWLFKTDSSGNLLWQHNYGGAEMESFKSVIENVDGSFTATGYTLSSTATTNGNKGKSDVWVARINSIGTILWSKGFGGSEDEVGMSLVRTQDDSYLVSGYTESNNSDVSGNNGLADAWLIKVAGDGNLVWQKCTGTNKNEFGIAVVCKTENDFIIAGLAEPTVPGGPFDNMDGYIAELGNSNTIKGLLFLDANSNGIKDLGEPPFNNAIVRATQGGYLRQSIPVNGLFQMDVEQGSYTTSPFFQSPYYTSVPASRNSNFAGFFNTDSFSFAIQPIANIQDINVSVIPVFPTRPGFDVIYKLYYKNPGTVVIPSGTVLFKHDSRLSFQYAVPAISSSNGDTLKWSYSNLAPFDSVSITLGMHVASPPTVNNGDTLTSVALIFPVAGDVTPTDDTAFLKQRVVGSYDPNDKTENFAGRIALQQVTKGDYINYVIRFQNTGTDTAFTIHVRDTLDAKLDWNSLDMIAASHSYKLTISGSNQLDWAFPNIKLVDSIRNEPASHGFIAYRIKPKNNLVVGDIVENSASVYFDFNLPVKTNNALTEVTGNTALPLTLISFNVVYHNEQATLHWSTQNEYNFQRFEIERSFNGRGFTFIGAKNAIGNINNTTADYDWIDNLANVSASTIFYRLKMIDIDGKTSYSKVVLVRKNSQPSDKITLLPNPVVNYAQMLITSATESDIEIRIINASGKRVLFQRSKIYAGNNSIIVNDVSKLVNGIYLLQVVQGDKMHAIKFIIAR